MGDGWGAAKALFDAFVKHRTDTHEITPSRCKTCLEGDEALERFRAEYREALRGSRPETFECRPLLDSG